MHVLKTMVKLPSYNLSYKTRDQLKDLDNKIHDVLRYVSKYKGRTGNQNQDPDSMCCINLIFIYLHVFTLMATGIGDNHCLLLPVVSSM